MHGMSLTKDDLTQIRFVINDAFETLAIPRFEAIESKLDEHSAILNEHASLLKDHSNQLRGLHEKVDNIEGRLKAIEADIKELYHLVGQTSSTASAKKFAKLNTEQKMLSMYNDFQALAKQLGIKLPSS